MQKRDSWDYGKKWMVEWLDQGERFKLWWNWWSEAIRIQKAQGSDSGMMPGAIAEGVPNWSQRPLWIRRRSVVAPKR